MLVQLTFSFGFLEGNAIYGHNFKTHHVFTWKIVPDNGNGIYTVLYISIDENGDSKARLLLILAPQCVNSMFIYSFEKSKSCTF